MAGRFMTRDEWNAVLATKPATPNQVGAILREFARLGYRDADRAGRLAVSAAMLGLDELASTTDLVMGDAGRLLCMLRDIRDRGELTAMPPAAQPVPARPVPWSEVIAAIAAAWQPIWNRAAMADNRVHDGGDHGPRLRELRCPGDRPR